MKVRTQRKISVSEGSQIDKKPVENPLELRSTATDSHKYHRDSWRDAIGRGLKNRIDARTMFAIGIPRCNVPSMSKG